MRTHTAKSGYLPSEYIPLTFWLVPPPPFAQVHCGGCYRENFFIFFWIHYQHVLIILRFWFYFFVSPIRFLLVFYFFYFFRFSFGLSDIRFSVKLVYIRSILSRLRFLTSLLISTRFYSLNIPRINFDLFQHCKYYALTLLLVINKHLCLFKFVLCLFWLF